MTPEPWAVEAAAAYERGVLLAEVTERHAELAEAELARYRAELARVDRVYADRLARQS